MINGGASEGRFPQRLKPRETSLACGTTEVVPFQNTEVVDFQNQVVPFQYRSYETTLSRFE